MDHKGRVEVPALTGVDSNLFCPPAFRNVSPAVMHHQSQRSVRLHLSNLNVPAASEGGGEVRVPDASFVSLMRQF